MRPNVPPCTGANPCVVTGCTCAVPRWTRRASRVRACTCCIARLQPTERALFAKETTKSGGLRVRAVLALLAGELAFDVEEQAAIDVAAAAQTSPFLDELDPETAERARKLMGARS